MGSGTYFAMCEGNQSAKIPPSVMKLVPNGPIFSIEAHGFLPVEPVALSACGGHHVDAFGDFLYCGSNEGYTYVLRKDTLAPVTRIVTGPGNGHTGFIQESGVSLGVTINHTAQSITIFDLVTHSVLRSVQVSTASATATRRTQGHTSGKIGTMFYMMASLDSAFHEIDALSGVITRSLHIPAKDESSPLPFPMQGVFMLDAPGAHCTQCG
jgi:hypothetical protein